MRKSAQAILYVSSIVLAIGIGAWQVGKTAADQSAGVACNYRLSESPGCKELIANKNISGCTGTFFQPYAAAPGLPNTKRYEYTATYKCLAPCNMSALSGKTVACGG